MDWTERRERLRSVIAGSRCIYPGSVYDAISARIAEDLGFEAGMFAGSIASFTVLGAPDIVMLTLTEFAQQAYRINRAGKLPLLVDAHDPDADQRCQGDHTRACRQVLPLEHGALAQRPGKT